MNGLGKRKQSSKRKIKVSAGKLNDSNGDDSEVLITQVKNKKKIIQDDPELIKKQEEERKKHEELQKQINEIRDKLNFETKQRQNIIAIKIQEIQKREEKIKDLSSTNNQLEKELKTLEVQVQQNLDNLESKEKNDKFESDKNKKQNNLEQRLKVKEKDLKDFDSLNNNYKKKKEKLQKELDSKVNMEQINDLNSKIKVSANKLEELQKEKEYLEQIQEEHMKCEEEKSRIKNEIINLQKELADIKSKIRERSKMDRHDMSLIIKGNNNSDLYKDLNEEQKEEKKKQIMEDDLRKQIHRVFIEGLNPPAFSEVNLNDYLKIKKFKLFDCVIDIKRFVEEHMNMIFYKMTTLNLNDWQTYQQMRVLAKHKYGLNLHEIYLPSQNLAKGKDILDIIRNLRSFTQKFTHNLHNQIFIEISQDSTFANVIGVKQILNSLYTHGPGIVNSVVNKAFGYISKNLNTLLEMLFDDYILSMLKDERTYWNENKSKINYNYPLERALNLRTKILTLDDNKKVSQILKAIQIITQIGNAVALARCIRTALMDYNSQNVNLLTINDISDYNKIAQEISLQVENDPNNPENNSSNISSNLLNNIQNSLNECNKIFCETINNLKQIGKNNVNYLEILVSSFKDTVSCTKIPEIEMFSFLLPPLTITFIDNAINARDNLLKKNKNDEGAYFSDDGFMVGVCYLLKIFSCDKKFESLNWFPSVINYYKLKQSQKQKKDKNSYGVNTLNERQINSYKEQFEMQYYTYTSASILFT